MDKTEIMDISTRLFLLCLIFRLDFNPTTTLPLATEPGKQLQTINDHETTFSVCYVV